jgi:hypothetical protein
MVTLFVRDLVGHGVPMHFRVDTAADCTAIPTTSARQAGIPFQKARASEGAGLVGQVRKYRDTIRIVLAGREHVWPCDFVEVPTSAPIMQMPDGPPIAVVGRAGFLSEYAVSIDDDYLIITRLGPVRRLIRRFLHALWVRTGQVHPAGQPL